MQKFLEVASRQLASRRQADEISGNISIKKEPEDDERIRKIKHKNPKKRMQDAQESVCNRRGMKHQPGYCRALGQICLGCGKKGHFKKMCKSGSKSNQSCRRNRISRRVREETSEESPASDNEDDYPIRLGKLRVRKTRASFSQVEDMSRRREKAVDNASIQTDSSDDEEEMKLKKVKQKVIAANNTSVPINGKFDATMYNKTRQVETEAFIMNGSLGGGPLLSKATLLDLGYIKYDPEGKFHPPNRFTTNHINTDKEDVLKSIALPEPTNQEEKEEFQKIRNLIKDKSEMFKVLVVSKSTRCIWNLKKMQDQ